MELKAKEIQIVDIASLVTLKNFYKLHKDHVEILVFDRDNCGYSCLFDYSSIDKIKDHKWRAQKNTDKYIAVVATTEKSTIIMSRIIAVPSSDMFVDHVNGNPLDNRVNNLRICTHQQNMLNRAKGRGAFKGVYFDKSREKWCAQITVNGKTKTIGRYLNEIEAAIAYDSFAKKLHGEFARLNFV